MLLDMEIVYTVPKAWCLMQVQTALGEILRNTSAKGLPCGVFGSFGWSGEAVDELEKRLRVNSPASSPGPVLVYMLLYKVSFSPDASHGI